MEQHTKQPDPIRDKTFNLAVRIVRLSQYLTEKKKEYIISKQLFRSGTNPGAMVREAKNAESAADFIHKLAIAQKETGETLYWLELLHKTEYINSDEFNSIHNDADEVMRIIRSSILTKKKNLATKTISIALAIALLMYNFYHP
jgi:four helix bundle protein